MVFFHDLAYPEVARGLEVFMQAGWRSRVYHTQQIVGVAWRGLVEPPQHFPDPRFEWSLTDHLRALFNDDGSSRFL